MLTIELEPELELSLKAEAEKQHCSVDEVVKNLLYLHFKQKKRPELLTDIVMQATQAKRLQALQEELATGGTEGQRILNCLKKAGLLACMENESSHLSENYKDYLSDNDKPNNPLKLGLFKGQVTMTEDFNEELPDSFWLQGSL